MGADRPKAFLDLGGQPLLLRAALAFDEAPSVERLVAVVSEDQVGTARGILSSLKKKVAVVPGGPRRQDSVLEGGQKVFDFGFKRTCLDILDIFREPEIGIGAQLVGSRGDALAQLEHFLKSLD